MFWDQKIETLDRAALERLQLKRLQETVRRVVAHVPFYRQKFAELGVMPEDIRSLADLRRLPFTGNADLRANYPTGLLAVPYDATLRLHTSSGTTGKPKALFFSRQDVDNAAELCARSFVMTGITQKDVFQNMMTYGMFTGALVTHYGAEKVGCLVIPAGPGNSERQLMLMQDFRTTFIHLTPSYALYLATFLEKHGVNPRRDLALRKAFVGAEAYTEETCRKIEDGLSVDVYNSYGLSEMNGPGIAFECEQKHGMHLWEDHFLIEIIDPQTGEPLPDGEAGELVMTTLTREAMPLLRYRTRDITSLIPEPCRCGRTHRRPFGRHAHRARREHLPAADRARPDGAVGGGQKLSDRAGRPRRDDGQGGTGGSRFRGTGGAAHEIAEPSGREIARGNPHQTTGPAPAARLAAGE